MTTFASDLTQQKEMAARATARLAFALSSDSFLADDVRADFTRRGFGRYLKAATDPILSTDANVLLQPLDTAFVGLVDARSALGRLLQLGAISMPLNGAARLQLGTVDASEVAESALKPVAAKIDFALSGPPQKCAASIVASAEALRSFSPDVQSGLRDVLVAACARAVDRLLVTALTASPASSSTAIGDLFASLSSAASPVLIGGVDALLGLPPGTANDLQALGVTTIATPAATGTLIAVDAAGVLVADGGIELATAQHADIVLDDGQAPPSSTVTNLWQMNLIALRAERFLRIAVRSGASAWAATT